MRDSDMIQSHEDRLQRLEAELPTSSQMMFLESEVKRFTDNTEAKIEKIATRVEGISLTMDQKLDKMNDKIDDIRTSIDTKLDAQADRVHQSFTGFTAGLEKINEALDQRTLLLMKHESEIASLRAAENARQEVKAKVWKYVWRGVFVALPAAVSLWHQKLGALIGEILK